MSTSILLTVFIPGILGFVMFGIGVSLTRADFRRVLEQPRAVGIGLFCQLVLLPVIAYLIALIFKLSPPYAIGLMILAASPGGSTANLFSHLTGGNVALNITLTAISSMIAILSVPLIIQWSLRHFLMQDAAMDLKSSKLIQTVFMVLIPLVVGLAIGEWRPFIRERLKVPVQMVTILLLIVLVISSIIKEKEKLIAAAEVVGAAVIVFNIISLIVGYSVPRFLGLSERDAIAVTFEVGIHNGAVAMALAANPLIVNAIRGTGIVMTDFSEVFPAAAYVVVMNITGGFLIWFLRQRLRLKNF